MSYTILKNTTKTLKIKIAGSSTFEVDVADLYGSCSNVPTTAMYNENIADIDYVSSIPAKMAINQETFSDQEGIVGALLIWAQYQAAQKYIYFQFWEMKASTCLSKRRPFFVYHCNLKDEVCKMNYNTIRGHELASLEIAQAWQVLVSSLAIQLGQIQENELIYSTNQQLQALLTQVLANTNVIIAESNIKVQAAENRLLDLKRKELEQKAIYVILPLVLVLAVALIYNE